MIPHIPFWWNLNIYRWQDGIEILFFTAAIYYLSVWLYQDKHKSLLLPFYGYCALLFVSHHLHFSTMCTTLVTFMPIAVVFFILIHHETLQKNFITMHAITPLQSKPNDWIELIVRTGLTGLSENKSLTFVIEKKQPLQTLVDTTSPLGCPLSSELLRFITTSVLFKEDQMLWIDTNIKLQGCNATWKTNSVDTWLSQEIKEQEQWLQDALFFTSKTDALFIKLLPKTRTFTLIAQGKIIEKASAQHACAAIKAYLGYTSYSYKGDWHGPYPQNISSERTLS